MTTMAPAAEGGLNDRGLPGFGMELQLDLAGCDPDILTSADDVRTYADVLIERIGMTAYGEPLIVPFGNGELFGITLTQLITTSNIDVITKVGMHAAPAAAAAHINVFSCRRFDTDAAITFSREFFHAQKHRARVADRSAPELEEE